MTGESDARDAFLKVECLGFDYCPGNNVDAGGDARSLSSYSFESITSITSYIQRRSLSILQ